ncbi:pirin family protein [Mesorhizobium sp. M2D.F.Ca.ET.185.01.1.1]|uniref:pirin family protein n=2 Tax=Mesorhizobium TaxID=68287 RepID=UPI000FCC808F|nr:MULTISPECIES: pirin family protein [unclassified Mesorhizobium]TGP56852.1 pirin family protein [bacterium M00.F.Ca.ET.230.01.1.1]TGP75523.1 pirin family protein [bacterium M00.F.Ca.ET.227.01.1.1]TGP90401.1 pirin family protein [bacterium M00.F.Ca.ET.222.01.1.1]TGP96547.1 pirin family protein [bacterium M00.F.Ca.ET.221.01.1.1]TGT68928.1 pirin family protein [bacterium M00.F.Ca.ET.159.01.1.1]TGT80790.1 pirin family protein [bacterium M00.F.Ca.ET.157.01.1.1]TGU02550.1 pirin family protein [b
MSFFPGNDPEPGDAFACDQIELMVVPNAKDIGGFEVRRALPTAKRRLVGPFIFFDRMGPAILRAGHALDVRPHPHIGLSTVTYLFDGKIRHRDSLGTEMVIAPGDVNLMTAGRGIVHSERTPEELRGAPMSVSGLQTWLALPDGKEEIAPVFANTSVASLPEIDAEGVSGRVVIGAFSGLRSPVATASDTLYADLRLAAGAAVKIPADAEERAIYTLEGDVSIAGDVFPAERLLVFKPGEEIVVSSERGAHFMLFGGASLGSQRYIWWNFVSSSKERIEQAKQEWKTGRFDIVPGDEEEFIPLPEG